MKTLSETDSIGFSNHNTTTIYLPLDAEIIDFSQWEGGYNTQYFKIHYLHDSNLEDVELREYRLSFYRHDDNPKFKFTISDEYKLLTTFNIKSGATYTKYFIFYYKVPTKRELRGLKIDEIVKENEH